MLFNSYIFVLFFLPLTIIGYFILNRFERFTLAKFYLLVMSLWFYGYFNYQYLWIILGSVIINYSFYSLFKIIEGRRERKVILIIALLCNFGTLFYFKYFDFFITNTNFIFKSDFILKHLVLPLGISFFTFQQVSFIIDSYRKEVPEYNFLEYALFVTFFPQLIAGPIVMHSELAPQFADAEKKRLDWDHIAQGLYIFAIGMAKKVLIADTFGTAANWGFSNYLELDTTNALIAMLAYTMQIYFDFSGYCDMAIGIGRMLNIDLPLNFDSPYKALTITEFWKRWHNTLTRFFTKYIYIPLGGSKNGKWKTYRNTAIIFLASGLWHGASWSFVLWGGMHGLFSIVTRHFKKVFDRIPPAVNWLITFSFVSTAWVFFRAETIEKAFAILKRISLLNFGKIRWEIASGFNLAEFTFVEYLLLPQRLSDFLPYINLVLFFLFAFVILLRSKNGYEKFQVFQCTLKTGLFTAFLLTWCILSFSGVSTFLYFNF